MENDKREYASIDEYIGSFPEHVRQKLVELRRIIKEQAPEAQERISWRMPTFYLNGNLVHFAAHAKHIGFYPGASGIEVFESEFAAYKHSKGAVQFPIDKPLPVELIKRIVKFRVAENVKNKKK